MKRRIFKPVLPALAALVLLGGCETAIDVATGDSVTFQEKFGWTEERMLRHGWLEARYRAPPAIYCYRTLATPECYRAPQVGEEGRLIGFFAPTSAR